MDTSNPTLNVLVDAHLLGTRETGNETYIASLLEQASVFAAAGFQPFALMSTCHPEILNPEFTVEDAQCANDLRRFFFSIPRAILQIRAALLHVTYHAPFWSTTPYVVTIHDVSYRSRPRFTTPRNLLIQNLLGCLTAARAACVVTPSSFSKHCILGIYPWLRERVFVTPYAAGAQFYPRRPDAIARVKSHFGIQKEYFLFVGAPQPRKNIARVVEAFLTVAHNSPDCQLVIAGGHTKTLKRLQTVHRAAFESRQIITTGYIPDDELACLYSGCVALVFPSLYEGFGIPVLEAMQCGAPVITSNATALPEVAGDAALLVDPEDTDAIAAAIRRVIGEPELRATLRARGFARAKQFSWAETARLTAQAYHAAIQA